MFPAGGQFVHLSPEKHVANGVHLFLPLQGFFRRSIQQKIQYRPCTKNQQCSILRVNRNRCQYCRLKKCIAVGMSRDGKRLAKLLYSYWEALGNERFRELA